MRSGSFKPIFSEQQIENGRAKSAAQKRSAGDFMSAGESALPGALQQLAGGVDKLNNVVFEAEIQERREQQELDVMKDWLQVEADASKFLDDFEQQNRGENAFNAEGETAKWFQHRENEVLLKWGEIPAARRFFEKRFGIAAISGGDRMRDYANRQRDVVFDSGLEAYRNLAVQKIMDSNATDDECMQAMRDAMRINMVRAQRKGLDPAVAVAENNAFLQKVQEEEFTQQFTAKLQANDLNGAQAMLAAHANGFDSASHYEAAQKAITAGVSYERGARDPAKGKVDCSGWIVKNNPHPLVQKGQTAAGIIKEVSKATGVMYGNADLTPDKVREGMLIGMDASSKYAGIDHIVQVIRDPKTGELMVTESAKGKGGVAMTPYVKWYAQWGKSGKVPLTGVVLPGDGDSGSAVSEGVGGASFMTNTKRAEYQRKLDSYITASVKEQEALLKEQRADVERNMFSMAFDGTLTREAIETNRDILTPDDYNKFLKLTRGESQLPDKSDPEAVIKLTQMAVNGDGDLAAAADDMLRAGRLTIGDYKSALNEGQQFRDPVEKQITEELRLKTGYSELNQNPDAAGSFIQAKKDYYAWRDSEAGKKASSAEKREMASRIAENYRMEDTRNLLLSVPVPLYLFGSRMKPDIQKTIEATEEAFRSGKITDAQYTEEAIRIKRMAEILERQQADAKKGDNR